MKKGRHAVLLLPLLLLLLETAYAMVAITEWPAVVAWVLFAEFPTLLLAIAGIEAWSVR